MAAGEQVGQRRRHEPAGAGQDKQRDAAQDERHRQRDDDRGIAADRDEPADQRADARPERQHGQHAAENAERSLHRAGRDHRAEADHRANREVDAAGQHDDGFRGRDHRRGKPALHELVHRAERENAREQDRVEYGEHRQHEEQRAESLVAPPLDRPIEPRPPLMQSPPTSASPGARPMRRRDDGLLAGLAHGAASPPRGRCGTP